MRHSTQKRNAILSVWRFRMFVILMGIGVGMPCGCSKQEGSFSVREWEPIQANEFIIANEKEPTLLADEIRELDPESKHDDIKTRIKALGLSSWKIDSRKNVVFILDKKGATHKLNGSEPVFSLVIWQTALF